MKRYRFRLEPVLRVRRLQEDLARSLLLAANAEVTRTGTVLERRLDSYRGAPACSDHSMTGFMASRRHHEALAASVFAAAALREEARHKAAEQVTAWSAAASLVRTLERLDERQRGEHTVAADRAEALEVDDLVTSRHGRRP